MHDLKNPLHILNFDLFSDGMQSFAVCSINICNAFLLFCVRDFVLNQRIVATFGTKRCLRKRSADWVVTNVNALWSLAMSCDLQWGKMTAGVSNINCFTVYFFSIYFLFACQPTDPQVRLDVVRDPANVIVFAWLGKGQGQGQLRLVWLSGTNSWFLVPVVMPHVWRSCEEPQHCLELLPVQRQDWWSVLFAGCRGEPSGVYKRCNKNKNYSLNRWLQGFFILSGWIYPTVLWLKWRTFMELLRQLSCKE